MIHKLNPHYQIPSRKYFSQEEIPHLYNEVKELVVNPKLKEMEFFQQLLIYGQVEQCMCYTIHFIDKENYNQYALRRCQCLKIILALISLILSQTFYPTGTFHQKS